MPNRLLKQLISKPLHKDALQGAQQTNTTERWHGCCLGHILQAKRLVPRPDGTQDKSHQAWIHIARE
eukprot:4204464-Amphidinium_carterae.1